MSVTLVEPTIAECPSLKTLREEWSIVIVDRHPGPMGPVSVGYIGHSVIAAEKFDKDARAGALLIGDPFDYQSSWAMSPDRKAITRSINVMPCEGFTVGAISITRHLAVLDCEHLTHGASEKVLALLTEAFKMRQHFRRAGSLITEA